MKNLHFNDYLIILIVTLMFGCCFFAHKWLSLRKEVNIYEQSKSSFKDELDTKTQFYQSALNIQNDKLNYFKEKANDNTAKKIIITKYKTIYEKINSTPDSLQFRYTDSILAMCRLVKFQRD